MCASAGPLWAAQAPFGVLFCPWSIVHCPLHGILYKGQGTKDKGLGSILFVLIWLL